MYVLIYTGSLERDYSCLIFKMSIVCLRYYPVCFYLNMDLEEIPSLSTFSILVSVWSLFMETLQHKSRTSLLRGSLQYLCLVVETSGLASNPFGRILM